MIRGATRSSEKAWCFTTGRKDAWLPQSLATLFINELVDSIERPQRGSSDVAIDAGGRP